MNVPLKHKPDYYSAPSEDTSSTATSSSSIFSPTMSTDTTAASSIVEEPVGRIRSSTPGPSSLRRSSSITRTQPRESVQPPPAPTPRTSMLPSQATALVRAPSYTYDDSYLCPTPAIFGSTDDLEERNLLARRNAELNASASYGSRRESIVLSLPPDTSSGNNDNAQIFPTIPLSASPEPIISTQVTANSAYSASDIIPFPSSLSMINSDMSVRLVSDDDQFIPPLANLEWDVAGKDPGRPMERPESRADRRSYASIATGQKTPTLSFSTSQAEQDRPLPVPPSIPRQGNIPSTATSDMTRSYPASQDQNLRTSAINQYTFPSVNSNDQSRVPRSRSNSISRQSPDSTSSLSRRNSIVNNNGQYMSHKSVQSLAQSIYSTAPYYYYQAAPTLSTMASVTAGVPVPATQNPPTKVIPLPVQYTRSRKSSLMESLAQRESQSQETRPMLPISQSVPLVPFHLDRRGSDGDVSLSRSRTAHGEMPRRLSDSDASVMAQYAMPPGHEPQRRHSDGDQYKKGAAARTVRWNENLICPSPIGADQRRKGWFNRRG